MEWKLLSYPANALLFQASKIKRRLCKRSSHGWRSFDDNIIIPRNVKTNRVLGVSAFFHDSSAALLVEGKLICASEEERFTRKKHDAGFPYKAIEYCLKCGNISPRDIDTVAFFEDPTEKLQRILSMMLNEPPSLKDFDRILYQWLHFKRPEQITRLLRNIGIDAPVVFIKHHVSHAASSYFVSGFDEAAILSIDGVGEKTTTAIGYGRGNELRLLKCIHFPDSLGLFYSAITGYLGFKPNSDEYKVMGLGSYGDPNHYITHMQQLVRMELDGSFSINPEFFCFGNLNCMYTDKLESLFGFPPRKCKEKINKEHENLAASLQKITEDVVISILNKLFEVVGSKNLCMAGGVALNSVLNGKILLKTPFKRVFIQPAAGDGGSSLGAAKYLFHMLNLKSEREIMYHSSFGPQFSQNEIQNALDKKGVQYIKIESNPELIKKTARLIYEDKIVAWFQGRMEWGPRALGNRSILANPCNPDMKDILNQKVKHREEFRPFAPVVCRDDAGMFFEIDRGISDPTDFMLLVQPVKKEERDNLPSITHVNGSARLQTIRRENNPLYYDLIKEFGRLSEKPILINTSFNIMGEPIVCNPEDALNCFLGTEIDYLIIGNFLVSKSEDTVTLSKRMSG